MVAMMAPVGFRCARQDRHGDERGGGRKGKANGHKYLPLFFLKRKDTRVAFLFARVQQLILPPISLADVQAGRVALRFTEGNARSRGELE